MAACETVTVSAHHEMIIPARILGKEDTPVATVGLVEARQGFTARSLLGVARTLMDGSSGLVPVRVANLTDSAITVYEATHIGTFYPLEEERHCTASLPVTTCSPTNEPHPVMTSSASTEKMQQDIIDLFQLH
jgi:hypothetical protein